MESHVLQKDVVLVGGGHAHIEVIRQFGMAPWPGVRLTVISRDSLTPYSGMLPGWVAGHYDFDDCHIDLQRLCSWAGARLFHTEVSGIDLNERLVTCTTRPPVRYDLLSLNAGSRPARQDIDGAERFAVSLKPIDTFMARWLPTLEGLREHRGDFHIAVVGGGAAGVEVCLAMQHCVRQQIRNCTVHFHLVNAEPELLPTHAGRVRGYFTRVCADRGIPITTGRFVRTVDESSITLDNGGQIRSDFTVLALHAASQAWVAKTGLDCDERGFIRVKETLESTSHAGVFAAGDNAALVSGSLAKSGVYAVRQGPVLAENLRRAAAGWPLKHYRPQRRFLSLVSTGDRRAIASRGALVFSGAWVWHWKDRIDRRFMQRYRDLPAMAAPPSAADDAADSGDHAQTMRCGGCGAKVGSQILERVLAELAPPACADALGTPGAAEDAAVLKLPAGKLWVQTVDYFREFLPDPWLLGRIGANHCLGDIYAMGARPHSALALCTVPYAGEAIMEDNLRAMLQGALAVLEDAGASLIGGHSSEGAEMAFGLSVNGIAEEGSLLTKTGLRAGDSLVLTKPLGTGTLLVANALGEARADWIDSAVASMAQSSRQAADILHAAGVQGCTDITGFGLLGHLLEMLRPAGLGAELTLSRLPLLDGVEACLQRGRLSSLHPQNWHNRRAISNLPEVQDLPLLPILFDPQTAGGLLAGVAPTRLDQTLTALRETGYAAAAIGSVSDTVAAGEVVVMP